MIEFRIRGKTVLSGAFWEQNAEKIIWLDFWLVKIVLLFSAEGEIITAELI